MFQTVESPIFLAMERKTLLEKLALKISPLKTEGPVLVGIDGVDGAGKTTLADELVPYIEALNRTVVRASIDGFHNPKEVRVMKGILSPEGYFEDSFDQQFLINEFLTPLKKVRHSAVLRSAKHDWKTESVVADKSIVVDQSTIVLFEGVFLFRPELIKFWDYKIYVQIAPDTSLHRGITRDSQLLGGDEVTRGKYLKRYIPGQKIYHDKHDPVSQANLVIQNDVPTDPKILREQ